jgi:AraC-like DNA-binding protein
MFDDNHLTLRLVRLQGADKWQPSASGLWFLFLRGGSGSYATQAGKQRLRQGDVLVLNGLAGGEVKGGAAGELAFLCFSASVEYMYPLFSVSEISLMQNIVESFKGIKFHPAGSPLAVECQRLVGSAPPQFNLDHRSHLLGVLATVLREEFKSLQLQRHRTGFVSMEEHLLQVFEKLSANELLNLSAVELAGKFGCSRRHLNRLFHQHFGFSIAALRMEMRMLKAVSLLRESAAKVINVAEQCGFNHLGLFNKCFRRRFGASPGQWRTQASQACTAPATNVGDHSQCPLQSNGLCPMLGGPGISNGSSPQKSQLRAAALSAVLSGPVEPRDTERVRSPVPPQFAGQAEPSGETAPHADA